jgi:hypothetical protein
MAWQTAEKAVGSGQGGKKMSEEATFQTRIQAAAHLEHLQRDVAVAQQEVSDLDSSLLCGRCEGIFAKCSHSYASSVVG